MCVSSFLELSVSSGFGEIERKADVGHHQGSFYNGAPTSSIDVCISLRPLLVEHNTISTEVYVAVLAHCIGV